MEYSKDLVPGGEVGKLLQVEKFTKIDFDVTVLFS